MSILLVAAASLSLSELCYNADKDDHSRPWLAEASLYYAELKQISEAEKDGCFPIGTEAEQKEAEHLVALDSTFGTLTIGKN